MDPAKKMATQPDKQDENYRPHIVPAALQVIQGTLARKSEIERTGDEPMAISEVIPAVWFDGGDVETTLANLDKDMEWCVKYMGWTMVQQENWKQPKAVTGKMTHMGWGVWFDAGLDAEGNPVPPAKRPTVDPNIRWCWSTRDLLQKHKEFTEAGIQVSDRYKDPQGNDAFDFWAMTGEMRLTAIEDPTLKDDSFADTNRFRIQVKDLKRSILWYQQSIGMELLSDHSDKGYVVMGIGIHYHPEGRSKWVLEENPAMPETGPIDGLFRPRCFVENRESFFAYHQYLKDSGANVSEMDGFLQRGKVYFHVYDPDGNRFDLSSF